jgi:hypothetical protein
MIIKSSNALVGSRAVQMRFAGTEREHMLVGILDRPLNA